MSNSNVDAAVAASQLDHAKSSIGTFVLPCGYLDSAGVLHTEVCVKEISGHEEDLLASKAIPEARKLGELIANCVTRLGPLTDRGQIAMAVKELLVGDRAFLLFAIRRVTVGDNYPFRARCPSCEKEHLYNIDSAHLISYR